MRYTVSFSRSLIMWECIIQVCYQNNVSKIYFTDATFLYPKIQVDNYMIVYAYISQNILPD